LSAQPAEEKPGTGKKKKDAHRKGQGEKKKTPHGPSTAGI